MLLPTSVTSEYLNSIPFSDALIRQTSVEPDHLLGFEPASPVITLGTRASLAADVFETVGWPILNVDRGGQATLHNPGQLVVFPVVRLRQGARAFVRALGQATVALGRDFNTDLSYDEARPGVYDVSGAKVAAIGLRIRRSITSHGIAINIHNDLSAFRHIRACGIEGARVACLENSAPLSEIFFRWASHLNDEVDKLAVEVRC